MEGGTLVHAQRIAHGQGIYVAPSIDFIPFLYTPLYPALLALLSFVLPLGYLLGRLVSIVAFAGALALVVVTSLGESRDRWRRILTALAGLGGAGAIVASFAFTGYFYDLVRSDSLLLALEALALWLGLRGRALWPAASYAVFGGLTPVMVSLLLPLDKLAPAHYVVALSLLGVFIGWYIHRRGALIS